MTIPSPSSAWHIYYAADQLRHKLELVSRLLEKGYDEALADDIFRLFDWMMVLPKAAERQFREQQGAAQGSGGLDPATSRASLRSAGARQAALLMNADLPNSAVGADRPRASTRSLRAEIARQADLSCYAAVGRCAAA